GNSVAALVKDMTGETVLTAPEMTLENFNPAQLETLVSSLTPPVAGIDMLANDALRKNGNTPLADVRAVFRIEKGVASMEPLALPFGEFRGVVDLPRWSYAIDGVLPQGVNVRA